MQTFLEMHTFHKLCDDLFAVAEEFVITQTCPEHLKTLSN